MNRGRPHAFLIYFLQILLILPAHLFSAEPVPPSDSSACKKVLSDFVTRVKAKMDQLYPLALDTPTISEGIHNLGRDLKSQSPRFDRLAQLEKDLIEERQTSQAITSQAEKLLEETAQDADKKLADLSKTPSGNPQLRRELEGHRLLLNRGERLLQRAQHLQTQQGKKELEQMKQEQQGGSNQQKEGQQESDQQQNPYAEGSDAKNGEGKSPLQSGEPSSPQGQKSEPQQKSSAQTEEPHQKDGLPVHEGSKPGDQLKTQAPPQKALPSESSLKKDQGRPEKKTESQPAGENEQGKSWMDQLKSRIKNVFKGDVDKSSDGEKIDAKELKPDPSDGKSEKPGEGTAEKPSDPSQPTSPKTFQGAGTAQVSMVLKKTFSDLWVETLRKTSSSQRLLDSLVEYTRLARTFHREHPEMQFLEDAAKRSEKLFEIVEGLQVSYKDPEGFLIAQIGRAASEPKELKAFLDIQKRVLDYLKTETALSPEEAQVYERITDLLKRLDSGQGTPSENQVAETFMKQLVGPLSARAIKREFPATNPLGVNVPQLVSAIQSGKLNDVLIMAHLKSILRISRFETLQPLDSLVDSGAKVPISSSPIDYTQAEDLQNPTKIYRDAPLKYDVKRLAAEDLVEQVHRDPIPKQDPREKKPKVVDIVLYDMSGSMIQDIEGQPDNPKAPMQTYMMAGFVDESQIKVAQGKARHIIYTMPFDGNPKPTETIETLEGSQRYFDGLRQSALRGNGGTAISAAILKALSLIREHQDGSGELRRANIVLFTDGGENGAMQIEAILNQRQQMDKSVLIAFHVVTLGEGNPELAALASQPERINALFQYSYQHLSYDEIRQIMNPVKRLEVLNQLAQISQVSSQTRLTSYPILSLKQAFVRLQSKGRTESISMEDRKAVLHVLSGSPKEEFSQESQAALLVFEPILQVLNSTGVRELLFEAKFKIFSNYLMAATRELEVSEETLLDLLPSGSRSRIREALGFPEDQITNGSRR